MKLKFFNNKYIVCLINHVSAETVSTGRIRTGLKLIGPIVPNWTRALSTLGCLKYTQQHTAGFTENNIGAQHLIRSDTGQVIVHQ